MSSQVDNNTIYGFALGRSCQGWYNGVTPLSDETLGALDELGLILRNIHQRMLSEGYEIADGRIRKVKK